MRVLLSKGSRGTQVKELQIKLNKILGDAIVVDGIFGEVTSHAVKQFQADYGLKVDGIVGNYTWVAIDLESNKESNNLMTFAKSRFVVFVDAGLAGLILEGADGEEGSRQLPAATRFIEDRASRVSRRALGLVLVRPGRGDIVEARAEDLSIEHEVRSVVYLVRAPTHGIVSRPIPAVQAHP